MHRCSPTLAVIFGIATLASCFAIGATVAGFLYDQLKERTP